MAVESALIVSCWSRRGKLMLDYGWSGSGILKKSCQPP